MNEDIQSTNGAAASAAKLATLVNSGALLEVIKQDGSIEEVRILELPIKKFPDLLAAMDDELKQVEIYCGKPAGWAELLTPRSHNEVMEKAKEINDSNFIPWARRRVALQEMIAPGLFDRALDRASTSPIGSQKSPLNADSRLGRRPSTVLPS